MSSTPPAPAAPPPTEPSVRPRGNTSARCWWPALAGLAAVLAGFGLGELVAGLIAPGASPVLVVGALLIDLAPAPVKELVIGLFGTADKVALIVFIALVAAALAAAAGVLEYRRPPFGRFVVVIAGLVALVAALTRADASPFDAVPPVLAMVVAALVLTMLLKRLHASTAPAEAAAAATAHTGRIASVTPHAAARAALDRRRFLLYTGVSAGAGVLAAIGGQLLTAGSRAADAARALFTLPAPSTPGAPIAAGASFDIDGLAPIITPNADFYRIDTALSVPRIDPSTWTLKISGLVENDVEIDFAELLALPLEESTTTLACVSNYVGGDLIGNAVWLGYPIRELLKRAAPTSDADMVLSRSQDGWTASTPLEALTDDRNAILAVGMNGDPLPLEHGYPVRMVVPGLYGYVSATKWVTELVVTRFDTETAYWSTRGWSEEGPVKLSSRVDVPRDNATAAAGTVTVAGVAWSQHVGVSAVDVQVDDGEWNAATLADAISVDTWRQWRWDWTATAGSHSIRVRATDANGSVQTSKLADVAPDGATGLHEVSVSVP
ncbi:molybdopterin-dependent oxidoreductase [Cryobacterium sp.]|jgi:DMSO/TMAO reductase YedYZ molybdopterin-dependent catalytic subunit|uniref:molybdopterin-dependent oxidoreductase n=1 Tax=Cryobacterium sp. TaxID=1926290 RepID=UPI00262FD1B4|nr:molybdopterin-dependent oxidoreductase [Cryobacterium sp.]MCU1446137.1 oxidoreductase [Cryobacterium sp.]